MKITKGKVIGILGGGQLAKMLCEAAKELNYKTLVLDPSEDACARFSADTFIMANYDDKEALKTMAELSSVITYEFENVPTLSLEILKELDAYIPQGNRPLYISQNRIREKTAVEKLGIRTAKFKVVKSQEDLKDAITEIGYPAILKTTAGGYDGKGQWIIRDESDLKEIETGKTECILEEMINFNLEVSCLVVRGVNGDVITFPVGENIHKNGILHMTIVPARIDDELKKEVEQISKKIIENLDFVGPLGIEFFIGKAGEIYFNEMAPRPHNSAHYTMDACNYSQFDIHLMGILGEKLPKVKLLTKVVMLNIMGEDQEKVKKIKKEHNTNVHIYGKSEWKKDRKMGHINYCGENLEELILKADSF
ncbi:MAG: 5-(carboxyamino)imidazole ribonucleotide synthase [Cetobacterium sp.]